MNCKGVRNKLIFFLDKELPTEEEEVIAAHLNSCNDCLGVYEKLKIANSIIEEEKQIQVNPLFNDLRFTILDLRFKKEGFRPSFNRILRPVYIAATFAAAVFIGIHLGNNLNQKNESLASAMIQQENTVNLNTFIVNDSDDDELPITNY